jgi:tetratricopeptide (TPR) repeat protein
VNKRKLLAAVILTGMTGAWTPTWADPETLAQATPTPAAEATTVADPRQQAQQALLEGRELYRKGFSESAIVQYRKAIELDPDLAQAYIELGKILTETKNNAYAITIYQKLAQLQPDNMQWKEILFELHTAYEMPREAAAVGEEMLQRKPDDLALIKRLAEVYKSYGLQDKYADTLIRGAKLSKDAKMYYDAGEAYLASDMKSQAVEAYRQAVAIEPTNLEYQNALGKGLNAAGDSEAAREHYNKVAQQFPQATGLRDRQAETEIAVGDRMLTNRRYVAARQSFERARDLLGSTSTDSGLGASIQERIAKAERLNHVYLDNPFQFGQQGDNDFIDTQTVIGIPLQDEDVAFQIINDFRAARAPGQGSSNIDSVQLGVDYKISEDTSLFARGGGFGIFRVGVIHQSDTITAAASVRRDIVSYTPQALRQRLDFVGADGALAVQVNDWFSLGGSFSTYGYGDDINEFTYNIGPRFTPINKPNDFIWGIGYNHGGVFNDLDANPLLRFGPTNFQVDSIGTDIEHWVNEDFRYRLGYYYSRSNVGTDGNTFLVGFDYQMGEGSYLWLNYEYGNFLAGRVAPGLFSTNASNYIVNGGLHVTF